MIARCPVRRTRIGPPRRGRIRDEMYLAWIRKQPCICCGKRAEAAHGQRVKSGIPNAPDQMMYSTFGGDRFYVALETAEAIDRAGVKRGEPFTICKRLEGKSVYWEVTKQQQARVTPPAPTAVISNSEEQTCAQSSTPQNPVSIGMTHMSQLLGSCMIAAIDAAALAREYAHSKGIPLQLSEESIQDLTSTAMIHLQKMADLEARYQVRGDQAMQRAQSGSAAWRQ